MTEILEKVKRKMEQLNNRIEIRRGLNHYDESKRLLILEERLSVYEDLLPDIASLITTIESQKKLIDAQVGHIDTVNAHLESQKEEIEDIKRHQGEYIASLEFEIESLNAITALSARSFEEIKISLKSATEFGHLKMCTCNVCDALGNVEYTLSQIERLQNEQT